MEFTNLKDYTAFVAGQIGLQADDKLHNDLFALLHWRELADKEKQKQEKIIESYKPANDDTGKKYLVFAIKKTALQKLARFHFFFNFVFVAILDLIYIKNAGLTISNLFVFLPLAIISVVTVIYFIGNIICSIRITTHIESLDMSKYVILRMGEPGTGKSSSGIYDAVAIAEKLWESLKFDYWKIKNKIDRIYSGTHLEHSIKGLDEHGQPIIEYKRIYTGNEDKIKRTVEIVEAYEFYTNHDCIPCFWSNIPIFKNGLPANIFTADHLMQKEKLIYKGVAFIDEIGSMLPPELSNNKIQVIDLMFRFTRQYKDFRIISTEQDGNATLISARRVTAENRKMLEQNHIFKPPILNWLTSFIEDKIQLFNPTDSKVRYISNLRTYVNGVGFRCFKFEDYGNLQVGNKGELSSRVKSFLAPPYLNCFYDDRTFKNLYVCKDEAVNLNVFTKPILTQEEIQKLFDQEILERAYKKKKGVA